MTRKRIGVAALQAALVLSTATIPVAASAQSSTFRPAAPISALERQQGSQANGSIIQQYGGPYPGTQAGFASRVGQRVAVQSGLAASPNAFTVTLLNSPVDNAFAIPGGYVYVTRQLMALMNDEAELAAVLGHEVAHVAARHSKKRQKAASRNQLLGALGQVLIGAVAGNSGFGQLLSQGIGTGSQLATLSFSRSQETKADDLAIQYLVRAGYDPTALASMLRSLDAQERLDRAIQGDARAVPEWASTHPDPGARVQRAASQAAATRATGARNRDAFLAAIDGMMYGEDPAQGIVEGRTFLHPRLRIAFTVPAGFSMENGADVVTISGTNAAGQFATAPFQGNLESYVSNVVRSLSSGAGALPRYEVRRTTVNGIPAAFTQLRANSGSTPVDVTVFAYAPPGNAAYHFVTLAPAGQGVGALGSMLNSFRTLSSSEAAAIKPRFVRVVTVRSGDTAASLAQRMAFDNYRLERFLVLNGLTQATPLRAGQRVKIVTY